jgi:hypothetical protein
MRQTYVDKAALQRLRDSVAFVGRLSDSIVSFGPFSLGVDGILSWIPGVGDVYSIAAGGFIILQGFRAGVSPQVLVAAGALMGVRTLVGNVPIAGAAFADLFTAHRWASAMIVKDIDRMLGIDTVRPAARWSPTSAAA